MVRIDAGRRAVLTALCAGLLTAACSSSPPAEPSTHQPVASTSPAVPAAISTAGAHTRYLKIARAGNHRLEIDLGRLEGRDQSRLAAAKADLRDAAATERLFDRRLLAISLPSAAERIARLLYRANQSRASLTARAAASKSLRQLHAYELRLTAANEPVEQAVKVVRSVLGLPPPETS